MRRLLFLLLALMPLAAAANTLPLDRIKLPPGFRIELFARVDNARGMALGAGNTLFVGSMRAGKVHAVRFDADYKATRTHLVAEGLQLPVGVAFRDGALYVSAVGRILRFDGIERRLENPPPPAVVRGDLPQETHHGWKFIAFGPDGKLYVPVGAPCNICDRDADGYANIMRMNPDGSQLEVYARGVRNSVGFDWHPQTKALWFTDNGRDWMGDDQPSCELNHAPKPGMHFGYPFCHAGTIPDPEFGSRRKCGEFTPPAANLGPHVAPLGMRFYAGTQFPADYRDRIFIALHGSWNRAKKSGYQVVTARLDGDRVVAVEPFLTGWLQGESNWGRPADVLVLPDGSLLVSDDQANAIYRVRYAPG